MRNLSIHPLAPHLMDFGTEGRFERDAAPPAREASDLGAEAQYQLIADDAMARADLIAREAFSFAESQIKAAQAAWSKECEERLCREAAIARAAFERKVSDSLVRALKPFLEEKQRQRVLSAFVGHLVKLLDNASDVAVTIQGPIADATIVAGCLGKIGMRTLIRSSDAGSLEAEVGATIVGADMRKWPDIFSIEFDEGQSGD